MLSPEFGAIQLFYHMSFVGTSCVYSKVVNFLKWDLTFALLSTGIAQLCFVSDLFKISFILLRYLVDIPFSHPDAAVAAVIVVNV